MSDFKGASRFLKSIFNVVILGSIVNVERDILNSDTTGVKLIISGGAAIDAYFNNDVLITGDYDMKLIAQTKTYVQYYRGKYPNLYKDLFDLQWATINYVNTELNDYMLPIFLTIQKEIKQRFNVRLTGPFEVVKKGTHLKNISYTLTSTIDKEFYIDAIVDLFVIDFRHIKPGDYQVNPVDYDPEVSPENWTAYHYLQFTYLNGLNNPTLAANQDNRYIIPYTEYDNVAYAGLGYVVWDTVRMMKKASALDIPKRDRYYEKFSAIINSLNNPVKALSCNLMTDFVDNCNVNGNKCMLNGEEYSSSQMIRRGQDAGLIPNDDDIAPEIKKALMDPMNRFKLCELMRKL